MKTLNLQRWSTLVAGALLVIGGLASTNVLAQDEEEDEDSAELDRVVITGSRIARTAIEGPSPVTVIDREQLDREGFTTVSEALKSLNQVSGLSQNEAQAGTFTQNANSIDLRNLGPGRVLILVDGRRASDYPLPYNGQSNIVNLSAIPLAAVDRIEFLASGASAIYGSDAVAGVVNIILRKDLANSLDLNVRYGDFTDGGGETVRFQGVGGLLGDKWNITYAFEFFQRDPIYAVDRDFMDNVNDAPRPSERINSRNAVEIDIFGSQVGTPIYVDPRDATGSANPCTAFPDLDLSSRPDPNTGERFYCGSDTWVGEQSILNDREQINFYSAGSYELGNHELFAAFNYFQVDANIDTGFSYYFNQVPFYAPNSVGQSLPLFGVPGAYIQMQRIFTNAELGGAEAKRGFYDEEVIDYSLGIRGQLFSPYWDYELSWSSANYDLERERRLLVEALVQDYFFDFVGGPDPFGFGFPVYNIDYDAVYSPITPELWNSLTDIGRDSAESSNDVIQAVITGDLFDLPAGTVGMAAVLEWGTQEYDIVLDPRLVSADYFWGLTGTGGGGDRDRYAAGIEFQIPLLDSLQVSVAGRYDEYDDITNVDGAFTYNFGVEYRPTDRILLRGSLASSFRAPDMHYVFADPSGFFTNVVDQYLCRRDEPGVPFGACTYGSENIFGERVGNPGLEEEEGQSITFGFVVEPIDNLSITADWWEVDLDNIVVDNPLARILELEADCRLGLKDINTGECQDAIGRITRNPADGSLLSERLVQVDTGPVNASNNKVQGIDASLDYRLETDKIGTFSLNLGWTHILGDDFNVFPEDDVENVRDQSINWRSRVRGTLGWQYQDFFGTLFGERFGSTRSYEGRVNDELAVEPRMGPQMYYNLSLGYELLDGKADVQLIVNNLFNEKPPIDQNWSGWPYFSFFNYYQFSLGQSWALQASYRFDY